MDDDEGRVNDLLEQCVDHAALRLSTGHSDALDGDLLARLQRLKATPLAPSPPLAPHSDPDGLQSDLAERLAAIKKDPSKAQAPVIALKQDPSKAQALDGLQRLKASPLAPNSPLAPHSDSDGLQIDLAERLAALKKDPSRAQASVIALKQDPSKAQAPASQRLLVSKKDSSLTSASERLPASNKDSLKASVPEVSKSADFSHPNSHGMHKGDASEVEKLLESVRDCVQLEKSHTCKSDHNNESDEDISDSEVDNVVAWAKDAAVLDKDDEDDASDGDLQTTPTAADSPQRKKKGSRWKLW